MALIAVVIVMLGIPCGHYLKSSSKIIPAISSLLFKRLYSWSAYCRHHISTAFWRSSGLCEISVNRFLHFRVTLLYGHPNGTESTFVHRFLHHFLQRDDGDLLCFSKALRHHIAC